MARGGLHPDLEKALGQYRSRMDKFLGRMRNVVNETGDRTKSMRSAKDSYEATIPASQGEVRELRERLVVEPEGSLSSEQQLERAVTPTEAARAFFAAQERLYGVFQGYVRGERGVDVARLRVATEAARAFEQQWRRELGRFPVVNEVQSARTALTAMIKGVDGAQKNELTREEAMAEADRVRRLKPQPQVT